MKSAIRRVREGSRWLRPYVTFIVGGMFAYVGAYHWWMDDVEPMSISFALFAIGLLIMGRAGTLYRERSQ